MYQGGAVGAAPPYQGSYSGGAAAVSLPQHQMSILNPGLLPQHQGPAAAAAVAASMQHPNGSEYRGATGGSGTRPGGRPARPSKITLSSLTLGPTC